MDKHVTLVAALNIGLGLMGVLIAILVFVAVAGGGLLSGDPQAIAITSLVGSAIGTFLLIVSVPGIIGGFGLLKHRGWARILILIISALDLFNVPVGTVIAIYTFWVMLNDETVRLFQPDRS